MRSPLKITNHLAGFPKSSTLDFPELMVGEVFDVAFAKCTNKMVTTVGGGFG